MSDQSLAHRASLAINPMAKKLYALMQAKQSNLALSADVTEAHALLHLADTLGPYLCILKTHMDIIADFTPALTQALQKLAHQHQFLIFEDRKFADIGNTVKHQYEGGLYRIADWADIVNAHTLPGDGIIEGLKSVGLPKQKGLLLLTEMSSRGHLFSGDYQNASIAMAMKHSDFVFGFITQHAHLQHPAWINMTPGVQFASSKDALGQQYITPQQAILENKNDIIIVGRGILNANQPVIETKRYQATAWAALHQRIK